MRRTTIPESAFPASPAGRLPLLAALLLSLSLLIPPAASAASYPKDLASPLLGARIRVNATTGVHLANGYPVPVAPSGTQDVSALLSEDFDGLEFAAGPHSFTIVLPEAQVVNRVAFLNRTAVGTFTALVSGNDPQLLGPAANRLETQMAGPDMINSAVFQPQPVRFIQVDLKITRPGLLGRLAVYGPASDLDYALKPKPPLSAAADTPPSALAPAPAPAPVIGSVPKSFPDAPAGAGAAAAPPTEGPGPVDVAALSAGARVTRTSSAKAGSDPAWLLADSLDSVFLFDPADPAPAFDVDFGGTRHADHAVLFLSGPPSRVEAIRIPAYVPPAPATAVEATLGRTSGTVEVSGLASTDYQAVSSGQTVKPGQIVRTGFGSLAEFEIGGHSLVRLGANSNAVLRAGAAGVEVHALRGDVLWQVYDPTGGGLLVTPTASAELRQGTAAANVKLTGASRLDFLETVTPSGLRITSRVSGQQLTLRPGEGIDVAPGRYAAFAVAPFAVKAYWLLSPVGASAGSLHGEVEKRFGLADDALAGGENLLGVATTSSTGLVSVRIDFKDKDQPLDAIRLRVTPLSPPPVPAIPILVVKAGVFGIYTGSEIELARKAGSLPMPVPVATPPPVSTPVPAPSSSALPPLPSSGPAPQPAPAPAPVPTPVPAPPVSQAAAPGSPNLITLKDDSAPAPVTPAPAAKAPPPASPPAQVPAQPSADASPGAKSIFDRQNTKGPQINFPIVGDPQPAQPIGR